MKKRVLAVLFVFLLLMGQLSLAAAHDDQKLHDQDLKYALFGSEEMVFGREEKKIFEAIANAAALTIDQFSPNTTAKMKQSTYNKLQDLLQELQPPALPVTFDDIDLNSKVSGGINITPNTHRTYTHKGWNDAGYPNQEFWRQRKQVLLHVVNWTLFNDRAVLSWLPWGTNLLYAPSEQCEGFCALIYYIHILGDHIEGDKPEKLTEIEPLVQYTSVSSPGIIVEVMEQMQIVFPSQVNTATYVSMMYDLTSLQIKAEGNCGTWSTIETAEQCEINKENAKELLDILSEYLPMLLRHEDFFSSHFH